MDAISELPIFALALKGLQQHKKDLAKHSESSLNVIIGFFEDFL